MNIEVESLLMGKNSTAGEHGSSLVKKMSVSRHNYVRLNELPLFRDIKEALLLEKQQQQQTKIARPGDNRTAPDKSKPSYSASASGSHYIPPLSAYNAIEETPYFPNGADNDRFVFDELTMRTDQARQKLNGVRTLGWDCIRPIGVRETMKQLQERLKERERSAKAQGRGDLPLPSAMQENGDDSIVSFHELNDDVAAQLNASGAGGLAGEEADEDLSYDYDAEFARVEEEEEEEEASDELQGVAMPFGAGNPLSNRGIERDVTIQQFVETSHVERQPYESQDEYESSQLQLDADQGESREFMEVPWVEVSDTVESVSSRRVSSLNSLTGHVLGTRPDLGHDT